MGCRSARARRMVYSCRPSFRDSRQQWRREGESTRANGRLLSNMWAMEIWQEVKVEFQTMRRSCCEREENFVKVCSLNLGSGLMMGEGLLFGGGLVMRSLMVEWGSMSRRGLASGSGLILGAS
jgi:hypothetical protein